MFDVHATQEEDRLVLLSAIDSLGRCTEEQLLRFCVETQLMNQFQFYLALAYIRDSGFVRESEHIEGKLLVLTPEGRQSLELFSGHIRPSQTEKLQQNGTIWRTRVRNELSMPSSYEQTDGGYRVCLRALEGGTEIFNLTVLTATKVQAKRFCERWQEKSDMIYQTVMQQLGETQQDE